MRTHPSPPPVSLAHAAQGRAPRDAPIPASPRSPQSCRALAARRPARPCLSSRAVPPPCYPRARMAESRLRCSPRSPPLCCLPLLPSRLYYCRRLPLASLLRRCSQPRLLCCCRAPRLRPLLLPRPRHRARSRATGRAGATPSPPPVVVPADRIGLPRRRCPGGLVPPSGRVPARVRPRAQAPAPVCPPC
nr:DBF4-type zinc finger-containing protein 2 homolog [Aegilops tauschii subsp. strangulata]